MKFGMTPAPFQRSKRTTTAIMLELTAALLVVSLAAIIYQFSVSSKTGVAALLILVTSVVSTIVLDVICALLQKKPVGNFILKNYSYVTAIIFALTLPVGTHLYVVAVGAIVSTLIGKAVFGGFGKNFANPAIVGRIFVAITFGSRLTSFVKDAAGQIVTGATLTAEWAGATKWLDAALPAGKSLMDILLGARQGAIGETFTILILVLGVILAIRKVIDYRQPLFFLGTVAVAAVIIASMNGYNVVNYTILHLSLGGLMFGAIFMLTDPVSTPTSPLGKIITSILAGLLVMLIRVKAGMTEGVMFAILLVNVFTPMIEGFIAGSTTKKLGKQYGIVCGAFAFAVLFSVLGAYRPSASNPSTSTPGGTTTTQPTTQPSTQPSTIPPTSSPGGSTTSSPTSVGETKTFTKSVEFTYTDGGKSTTNVSITVEVSTKKITAFSASVTGTETPFQMDPAYVNQFASNGVIVGKTIDQVKTLVANSNAGISAGATGSATAYKAAMADVITQAEAATSGSTGGSSKTETHSEDYTFGKVNVSVTVDGNKKITAFTMSAVGGDAFPLEDAYKNQFAVADKLVGKTVAEAQALISGSNAGLSAGATETADTYKKAMAAVLGKLA